MKPCHKQNPSLRRPSEPSCAAAAPGAAARTAAPGPKPPEAAVHRYVHPIRTARTAARPSMEELLGDVLEALSRQSEQLEEVLRRLERDNSDTN